MESEVEGRRKDLGGSLPVENVQALASKNTKDIPPRYLRPEVELDEFSVEDSLQIPIIDMSKLTENSLAHDQNEELAKLRSACRDWGFFQVLTASLNLRKNIKIQPLWGLISITLMIRNHALVYSSATQFDAG